MHSAIQWGAKLQSWAISWARLIYASPGPGCGVLTARDANRRFIPLPRFAPDKAGKDCAHYS